MRLRHLMPFVCFFLTGCPILQWDDDPAGIPMVCSPDEPHYAITDRTNALDPYAGSRRVIFIDSADRLARLEPRPDFREDNSESLVVAGRGTRFCYFYDRVGYELTSSRVYIVFRILPGPLRNDSFELVDESATNQIAINGNDRRNAYDWFFRQTFLDADNSCVPDCERETITVHGRTFEDVLVSRSTDGAGTLSVAYREDLGVVAFLDRDSILWALERIE